MADPKKDNYRSVPAFNYEYPTLVDCVTSALIAFTNKPATIFLLLYHHLRSVWLVMPWAQFRLCTADHTASSSTVVFRGNLFQLRDIAYSFPPDLFNKLGDVPAKALDAAAAPDSEDANPDPAAGANGDAPNPDAETIQ